MIKSPLKSLTKNGVRLWRTMNWGITIVWEIFICDVKNGFQLTYEGNFVLGYLQFKGVKA